MLTEQYDNLTGLSDRKPLVTLAEAGIQDVDDLVVFGDSLSDMGNVYNVTTAPIIGALIPDTPDSPPYFDGRFTNGLTWVEVLAQNIGAEPLTASTDLSLFGFFDGDTLDKSVNFAFGGAEATVNGGTRLLFPDLSGQIAQFTQDYDRNAQLADPEDIFVIWAGANDYLFDSKSTPQEVVGSIVTGIESLYQRGGRDFLIPNLPDLGQTPGALNSEYPRSSAELTNLTNQHNSLLAAELTNLDNSLPADATIVPLDVNSIFKQIIAQPQNFGISNVSQPSLNGDAIVANPDQSLFWDDIHPTALAHRILADYATSALG